MADSSFNMDPLIEECKLYGIDISVIMKIMPLSCSLKETFHLRTEKLLLLKKLDISQVLLRVKEDEISRLRAQNDNLQRIVEEREEEIKSLKENPGGEIEADVFDWSRMVPPDVSVPVGAEEQAEEPETEKDAEPAPLVVVKTEKVSDVVSGASSDGDIPLSRGGGGGEPSAVESSPQSSSTNSIVNGEQPEADTSVSQDAPDLKKEEFQAVPEETKVVENSKNEEDNGLKYKFFMCNQCGSRLPSRSALRKHLFRLHSTKKSSEGFRCDKCSRLFLSKAKLMSHESTAHSDVKHQCRYCHKAFYRPENRRRHEREHDISYYEDVRRSR